MTQTMQMLLVRTVLLFAGNVYVLSHKNDGKIRTKELTRDIGNIAHTNCVFSCNRESNKYNSNDIDSATRQATGVSSLKTIKTSEKSINATNFQMNRITGVEKKHFGYTHFLSNKTGTALDTATAEHKHPRRRRKKKLNSEMPATMGTPGGHNNSKPPSMGKRREHKRNHRRKRGTKEHHKKTLKSGRKRLNKSSVPFMLPKTSVNALSAPLAMWEPLPRPLALTATDFPPDLTRNAEFYTKHEEDPWDATPMTPPYEQDEENDFFPNPFYPVTSETYGAYAITCVSVLIFVVGITGNIAIMCIVCHNYYMRSISNALLANLAVWDFVILFFCLPLVVFHELTKTWLLGQFTCRVIPYIEVASLGVTTFTLCALCIDRFRAATNVQMYYEMIENCTSTTAKLAVIWIGALLLALPELLIRQLVTEDGGTPDDPPTERCLVRISTTLPDTLYVLGLTYSGARLWWCFGCYFCLPTLFTIGCSLVTARKIRRAEQACARGNKKQIRLESQMNCTVVALAIVYGACVVPENICNIVSAYMAAGVPEGTMALLHLLSQLLLFCRAAVTPALLLCLCRPFGRAFLDCCCCCCGEACGPLRSSATTSDDNEHECTTELELSPFSTIRREMSNYTAVGSHC